MPDYRIVKDEYSGFEVQMRTWWLPIWRQPKINTHSSKERARAWALRHATSRTTVEYLGNLKEPEK